MTRLGRSDSLRSDDSRAKVSFNRDVHVRRIGGRTDWNKDMREAEEVLRKARSVESIAHHNFNSLPRNSGRKQPINSGIGSGNIGSGGGGSTHSLGRRTKSGSVAGSVSSIRSGGNVQPSPPQISVTRTAPPRLKKQLSPILEADSPSWNTTQLYATVRKNRSKPTAPRPPPPPRVHRQSPPPHSNFSAVNNSTTASSMDDEPSPRIKRLIVNTESQSHYLSSLPDPTRTPSTFRRHSTTSIRHIPLEIESESNGGTSINRNLPPAPNGGNTISKKKKKSLPDKVKSLFAKKKKDEENKDPLKARYSQYNGTTSNGYNVNTNFKSNESPENKETWFKSLDRRLRKTASNKQSNKMDRGSSSQEDNTDSSWTRSKPFREKTFRDKKPLREKPLRFFGDTEDESDWPSGRRYRDTDGGYSSATSAKSVVYLHSPAVVDIPGKLSRRSMSREELSPRLDPRKRTTVSRSFSMLAPWRPTRLSPRISKLSSGDETDSVPPTRPPRKLVFTGPPLESSTLPPMGTGLSSSYRSTSSIEIPVQRSTSLYSRDTRAGFYGRTRK